MGIFDSENGDDSNGSKLNLSRLLSALIAPSPGAGQMAASSPQSPPPPPQGTPLEGESEPSGPAPPPPPPMSPGSGLEGEEFSPASPVPSNSPSWLQPGGPGPARSFMNWIAGGQPSGAAAPAAAPGATASSEAALENAPGALPGGAQPQTGPIPLPQQRPSEAPSPPGVAPPPPEPSRAILASVGPGGGADARRAFGLAPPPPPASGAGAGPWMSGIFGDPRLASQMAGGLGAGLKAVGANWNKPGLAALAGTAGAAIEGGQKGEDDDFKKAREAKAEELAYSVAGDNAKVRAAQARLADARAAATRDHGTVQSRKLDYDNSDRGKLHNADIQSNKELENWAKYNMRLPKDILDPEDLKKQNEQYEIKKKEIREKNYRNYGWTPAQVEKIRNQGKPIYEVLAPGADPATPRKVDIKATMEQALKPQSVREFHAIVQPGDYFINPRDGTLRIRKTEAPPPVDAPGGVGTITAGMSEESEAA